MRGYNTRGHRAIIILLNEEEFENRKSQNAISNLNLKSQIATSSFYNGKIQKSVYNKS